MTDNQFITEPVFFTDFVSFFFVKAERLAVYSVVDNRHKSFIEILISEHIPSGFFTTGKAVGTNSVDIRSKKIF